MYAEGDYDLAGFCVGAVERASVLTGAAVAPGDVILGLASSGVHSNGFSLVRRIIADRRWNLGDSLPSQEGRTLGATLLEPTRIYVRSLLPLVQQGRVKGLAHITGGGLLENIPRVLPEGCHAWIAAYSWALPPIFAYLQESGRIVPREMARTFNCGIGMAVIVTEDDVDPVVDHLSASGETVHRIGVVKEGRRGCTISAGPDTWNAGKAWFAEHNA
jgi:phosphoribosylformylglycinamidine cyclo-ligase